MQFIKLVVHVASQDYLLRVAMGIDPPGTPYEALPIVSRRWWNGIVYYYWRHGGTYRNTELIHTAWLFLRTQAGWKFGREFDPSAKTDPWMREWRDLDTFGKARRRVIRGLTHVLGELLTPGQDFGPFSEAVS
jgi:hypothetical protein